MIITVQREQGDANATPGELFIDGLHFCWTLEPRRDKSQGKPYCIGAGTFDLLLGWSDHFQMIVPKLVNVPDFTAVEMHPGNYPKDTHACTLVGETRSTDFVGMSDACFKLLMSKLLNQTGVRISYIDPTN